MLRTSTPMTSIASPRRRFHCPWVATAAAAATLLLTTLLPISARAQGNAGIVAAINASRAAARCATPATTAPGTPAANSAAVPLQAEPLLDAVAMGLAHSAGSVGRPLTEVVLAAGYRATRSMVIQVSGAASAAALARTLEQRFCAQLVSGEWQEIGLYQRSSATGAGMQVQTWLVLASRFMPPGPEQSGVIGQRVLDLVNRARAQARNCGTQPFATAGPLKWNDLLTLASQQHSGDMATHSYFSHDGRDGSLPAQRATRAGYLWRATGENIAGGQTTAEAAVQGWIDSPPHCANLMGAQFTEMGVAFAVNPRSKLGIYWTQMFGAPR